MALPLIAMTLCEKRGILPPGIIGSSPNENGLSGGPNSRAFALLEIKPVLHVVKTARAAAVVAGEQAAGGIEFQSENVAAALGENLELAGVGGDNARPCSPRSIDRARRGVDAGACDAATHRAALCAVQPAVWPPRDAVGHRVRVLKTKPG